MAAATVCSSVTCRVASSSPIIISYDNANWEVSNNSEKDIFIPNKTATELAEFFLHYPSVVAITTSSHLCDSWFHGDTSAAAAGTATCALPEITASATGQSSITNDVFHFVYKPMGTTGTVIVNATDVDNGGYVGAMIRESLNPNARTVLFKTLIYNPNVFVGYRENTGSSIRNLSQVNQLVHWYKITRNGSTFRVYTSYNGTSWMQRYSGTIDMGDNVLAGMFVESVREDRRAVGYYTDFSVSDEIQ